MMDPQIDPTPADQQVDRNKNEEKLLLSWDAPSRPFKKRDREYYTTIAIIVFLLSLILFFAGQFLVIAVVLSLGFVSYVLASVPPDMIHVSITSFGIHLGDQMFYWQELGRFWFSTKYKADLMHVETARAFPAQLAILLGDKSPDEVKKVMLKYSVFEKPRPTWLDNAAKWMQEKFPLEKDE
jgi:hypothetical protein